MPPASAEPGSSLTPIRRSRRDRILELPIRARGRSARASIGNCRVRPAARCVGTVAGARGASCRARPRRALDMPGCRRAACAAGGPRCRELALTRGVVAHRREQAVELVDEPADPLGVAGADEREILRRSLRDFPLHVAQRCSDKCADPNDREDDEHEHQSRALPRMRAVKSVRLCRSRPGHGDLVVARVGSIGDQADRVTAIHGVEVPGFTRPSTASAGRHPQPRTFRRAPDAEVDRVLESARSTASASAGKSSLSLPSGSVCTCAAVERGVEQRADRTRP